VLFSVARQLGCNKVVLGHHADDVAETVLLRLIRGAGVRGLAALAPSRPLGREGSGVRLVRPLLAVPKAQLLSYLRELGEPFCTDESNDDTRFTRNRVRRRLIPMLQRDFPEFSVESLGALNVASLELMALLEERLDERWTDLCRRQGRHEAVLDAERLRAAPEALQKAAVLRALAGLSGAASTPALAACHYGELAALVRGPVGREASLPGGYFARREHGVLYLARRNGPAGWAERVLPVPGAVELPEAALRIVCTDLGSGAMGPGEAATGADPLVAHVQGRGLTRPLVVRPRRPGDRFHPLGLAAPCRLKRFLIAARVPRHERDRMPLVATSGGEIVWVVGLRVSERFRVRTADEPALRLRAEAVAGG
jgi:tRNA(Ile)-lysidine synthase